MAEPTTWVQAPPRTPRPNRSIDVIPVHDVPAEHFVGYRFQGDPCGFPTQVAEDCYIQIGSTAGTAKSFTGVGVDVDTQVFGLYAGIECTLDGGLPEFRAIAGRVLEAGEHAGIDAVLKTTLTAAATALTPAATITEALGALEQKLAENVPSRGYIHLTPLLATRAASASLLVRNLDGSLETYLGTPVVVPVYANDATALAFASGPVTVWRTGVNVIDAPNPTYNKGRALAERLYSLSLECGAWSMGVTA